MKEQKKYIERSDLKNANHLEISVYYDKGGINCFSGQVAPRGYYISVRPVTRGNGTISFDLFTGCKKLLFEANRHSEKQFARAMEMAITFEDELIAAVAKKHTA